jgi:hypothetical protein
MAEPQHEIWWDDLKREVSRIGVPADLASLFADYLAGFALVKEFDSPKVDQNHPGRVLPDWRQQKRFLKKSGFDPDPSLRRPGSESLRSVINRFMEEKLATHPSPWKREFCGHTLCELWRLVEEEIVKAKGGHNAELEDRTSARISRRSRQRSKPTTKGWPLRITFGQYCPIDALCRTLGFPYNKFVDVDARRKRRFGP